MTSIRLSLCSAAMTLALGTSAQAQGFVRMEMIPIASTTLTTQQILAGETSGKPAGIAGQLRIPKAGTDKLPAIVLVHGLGRIERVRRRMGEGTQQHRPRGAGARLLRGPQHRQHGHRSVAARSSRHDGRCLPRARGAQLTSAHRSGAHRGDRLLQGRGRVGLFGQPALPQAVRRRERIRRAYRALYAVQRRLPRRRQGDRQADPLPSRHSATTGCRSGRAATTRRA